MTYDNCVKQELQRSELERRTQRIGRWLGKVLQVFSSVFILHFGNGIQR